MPDQERTSRQQRLAAIRREIAAGTYETPARIEGAIRAFLARHDQSGPPRARRPDEHEK